MVAFLICAEFSCEDKKYQFFKKVGERSGGTVNDCVARVVAEAECKRRNLSIGLDCGLVITRVELCKPKRFKARVPSRGTLSDDGWRDKALAYALWLAQRDGVAVPTDCGLKVRAEWSGVYNPHRTRVPAGKSNPFPPSYRQHALWNADHARSVYERRIQAVVWGRERELYATRKDGRQGEFIGEVFDVEFRIELPNWDFCPVPPVEEIIMGDA